MPQDTSNDVEFIKVWLSKEAHLPQNFNDEIITKFLHSCYSSLEKTKKCIDLFCSTRSVMPEVFTARDPLSPNIQTALSIVNVSSCQWEGNEIFFHRLDDPNTEKYIFYDFIKTHTLQCDYWLHVPFLAEGHYLVIDMASFTFKMISRTNMMFLKDYILFMLEAMPLRIKKIILINAPSYYDKLYALIKPALPAEICDIIQFMSGFEGLQKIIDKKCIPKDYGGEAQSMYEQNQQWLNGIHSRRKMFLDENLWKADIKKKPKGVESTMNGSFRSLSID